MHCSCITLHPHYYAFYVHLKPLIFDVNPFSSSNSLILPYSVSHMKSWSPHKLLHQGSLSQITQK